MPQTHPVTVKQIDIYPIKSLDVLGLQSVNVLAGGALQGDRRWSIIDEDGNYVNGSRTPLVHFVRSQFDQDLNAVEITIQNNNRQTQIKTSSQRFELPGQQVELEGLLSEHFGYPVKLQEDTQQGFPDDLDSTGPTLIGSATLEKVSQWFPELSTEQVHQRFRTNIILETETPFWEDRLFGVPNSPRKFRVGEVEFQGVNPCQRCVVPARNPKTGDIWPLFQKEFARLRKESLPGFAPVEHFDHYYRLAVNTQISPENRGSVIRNGDVVEIIDPEI
ncbi:MAG: MOSC N-terminal beta barrel domain-containing protein [Planctomycetaceae bacterium]|nr:MOSC N-terminal beta barrel domain-containing protein [Planctomycetaceae bacterium]